MPISARIEGIDRDVRLFVDEATKGKEADARFAAFAAEQIAWARANNAKALGRITPYTVTVDGRKGAPLSQMKWPTSVTVAEWELINPALIWIEEQLVKHSPFRTGRYIRSHVLFADGLEVPFGVTIPEATEYVFINEQPYARKIERGLSSQAPNGVYQAVAALARNRFGNQASIKYSFRSFPSGSVGKWAAGTSLGSRIKNSRRRTEWLTRQPAIVVTMRG